MLYSASHLIGCLLRRQQSLAHDAVPVITLFLCYILFFPLLFFQSGVAKVWVEVEIQKPPGL